MEKVTPRWEDPPPPHSGGHHYVRKHGRDEGPRAKLNHKGARALADLRPGVWVFMGEQPRDDYAMSSLSTPRKAGYGVAMRRLGHSRFGAYIIKQPE